MKYIHVFTDFAQDVEMLSDAEVGRLFRAMLEYASSGTDPDLRGNERIIWPGVKKNIDRDRESYDKLVSRNKSNRAKASPVVTTGDHSSPLVTTGDHSSQDKDKDKDKDKITPYSPPRGTGRLPAPRFVPPSVDDVRAYCEQRRNGVDPESFVNFYASKGWKVGSSPMKDWKAAVRTWEQRDGRGPGTADKPKTNNPFLAMALEMEDEA